jgi:hypothetical protein
LLTYLSKLSRNNIIKIRNQTQIEYRSIPNCWQQNNIYKDYFDHFTFYQCAVFILKSIYSRLLYKTNTNTKSSNLLHSLSFWLWFRFLYYSTGSYILREPWLCLKINTFGILFWAKTCYIVEKYFEIYHFLTHACVFKNCVYFPGHWSMKTANFSSYNK